MRPNSVQNFYYDYKLVEILYPWIDTSKAGKCKVTISPWMSSLSSHKVESYM